ncbi:MAG: undecaprenyl-diphosphate phosphatase [Rhodospirillales bacterium]|nr:undecaprenyl-diphosphate phosphatase [Rhodospirillales bacterium]MBO6787895.1 undecaprenyl-diphosphate phosphatase [Rhodospirillales bacterium]
MPILHLVILAAVQGITEFLPISSSGHLVLAPIFLGWPDQGLLIDVAVHVGTLFAVVVYLYKDVGAMLAGIGRALKGRRDPGARLFMLLVIGTIPVVGAGFALQHYAPDIFRSVEVIAWATLGFGILLWIADHVGMTVRRVEHLGVFDVIIIGVAQCLALIPGTSRSGITMTAARFIGMERPDAARFSLLLSIPTIIAAGTLSGIEIYESGNLQLANDAFVAAGLAFIFALIAIALMMAWLRRASFTPFVVYRVALGAFLLAVAYGVL